MGKKSEVSTLDTALGRVVDTVKISALLSVDVYEEKGILDSRVLRLFNTKTKDEIWIKASTLPKLFMDLTNKRYVKWDDVVSRIQDENT